MSSGVHEFGRYDSGLGPMWDAYDDWDFDALNEGPQDWDHNDWHLPHDDVNWFNDIAPALHEPHSSSSTLDDRSSPRIWTPPRSPPRNQHSQRLRSRSDPPLSIPPPSQDLVNRPRHTSRVGASSLNAFEAADDFDFGFNGETFDLDNPDTPSSAFDGIDIDDILNTDDESDMPSSTRRRQRGTTTTVDLTTDSSPARDPSQQPRSLKRSAEESSSQARAKRIRRSSNANEPRSPTNIEELDLTNEAPSAEEELRQTQQASAIAAQQAAATSSGPLKIGKRQCIICMEPFTDATITHCGHVYCHECLTQALLAGEKNSERGSGNCPVCRKPVKRTKQGQMVPINFMTRAAFREGKGRREVVAPLA